MNSRGPQLDMPDPPTPSGPQGGGAEQLSQGAQFRRRFKPSLLGAVQHPEVAQEHLGGHAPDMALIRYQHSAVGIVLQQALDRSRI